LTFVLKNAEGLTGLYMCPGAGQVPTGLDWWASSAIHTESDWRQCHSDVCGPCWTDAQVCTGSSFIHLFHSCV